MTIPMSPLEQVRAQLARQKWAVDTRDSGALIHQIGSVLAEPAGDERIRCRCYASILALDAAGAAVLRGYLSYDDIWALDAGEWRLAYRETVMFGYALSR
jgi:hypothetical protein